MTREAQQLPFGLELEFPPEAYTYGERASGETHGVVLTKPHVVSLILDLVGYTATAGIEDRRLLEPACGEGAFLAEAVRRLCDARRHSDMPWDSLGGAIRAYDVHMEHVRQSRLIVQEQLISGGATSSTAADLAERWVQSGDFLLTAALPAADYVIGNPPYVRIEHVLPALQNIYRGRFRSLYDRADLYVPFIEHGLVHLTSTGKLGFICADRWTLNRYGKKLRELVTTEYGVHVYIDLHKASPFESDVIAYPAIFCLGRERPDTVRVIRLDRGTEAECKAARDALTAATPGEGVDEYKTWFSGEDPWVMIPPQHLSVLRRLEGMYPRLEDEPSTKVGIGVATGNDSVFIVDASVDIEPDRLVPLLMRADIDKGKIHSRDRYVINAFRAGRGIVDLADYPRLAKHFDTHAAEIRKRHVAKKNPSSWFRTIDRVYPELAKRPKLLIPDIAGSMQVTYDPGYYHPHHNLYYVTSEEWDLEVLGGLLSSRAALFFVWAYAVKMRGAYLRFQAQYLRRIRVPEPGSLEAGLETSIRMAFRARDFAALDSLALTAYRIESIPDFEFVDTRE